MNTCPKCKASYKSSFGTNNARTEYECGSCFGGEKGFYQTEPVDYQTPICLASQLALALGTVMDAVSDMPASPRECWPEAWKEAGQALDDYRKYYGNVKVG